MAILLGCNSTRVRKLKWALARRSSWSWQPLCFRRVQHPTSNLKIRTGTKPQLLSSSFGRATIAGPQHVDMNGESEARHEKSRSQIAPSTTRIRAWHTTKSLLNEDRKSTRLNYSH